MFDTHCHLNFKRFKKNLDEVISRAIEVGVTQIIIPGTDITSSKKAIEIAEKHDGFYVAVGIHPHHAYELVKSETESDSVNKLKVESELQLIESLLTHPKVVAVGEVGMDRHVYEETKYNDYSVDERFIEIQRDLLRLQMDLAIKHDKSLILHNREAKADLLPLIVKNWDGKLASRTVLHCCEADMELLEFATKYHVFIGVDGDITFSKAKQEFIKQVPIEMLVVETDSPFILPEPLLSQKKYPNEPANLKYIVEEVAKLKGVKVEEVAERTTQNGLKLFGLD